jgi:hypothetical protein
MSRLLILAAAALIATPALAQPYDFTIRTTGAAPSTMTGTFNGSASFSGTFFGNYNATTNPTGTRTLNLNPFVPRPAPPTNLTKTLSGSGTAGGNTTGLPVGTYSLAITGSTVTLSQLNTNLVGTATQTPAPVNASVSYQSFMTASPDYSYPFLVPLSLPLGDATVTAMYVVQTADASGPLTAGPNGSFTFSLSVPADVTASVDFQGAPATQTVPQTLTITGSITPSGDTATASLGISIAVTANSNEPQPQPANQPFDLPPPTGTGDPAHLLLTLTINSQNTSVNATTTLPANGLVTARQCGTADFNGDTDFGTDQDIEAFFACLAGFCCPTCYPGGSDFNADGDSGTDQDIEAFFRVLSGAPC